MWIVRLALRRPYTFLVMALLIFALGGLTIFRMSTDVLPTVNIPVVSVVWQYNGLPSREMERRIVTTSERAMTTTVNGIEHIESQSLNGYGVIKVYFQPGTPIEQAVAQVTAVNQTIVRITPPGTGPPLILQYSASNVPILQAAVTSESLPESTLFDQSQNFIRTPLATVQGAQVLLPSGGKPRQIMVDLDPDKLFAKGVSPSDVSTAINNQNVILPSGTAKIGGREYNVQLNSSPEVVEALNDLPIKTVNGTTVYIRDVGYVRDGFAVQQNIVRVNGKRAALLPILKSQSASTIDIVNRVRAQMPLIRAQLPEQLKVDLLFDQSVFVRNAVKGVLIEGGIAACLTALMILLFLGSLRSTFIVAISIPLAVLISILGLSALGQTLNLMTLGGLSLAVGILVDDATVEIENIHRNLGENKPLRRSILDGAQQIAVPAFVATLCICVVFTPVIFISGAARDLFTPLAMGVVFAVAASYLLSRTIVPTMVLYLLPKEVHLHQGAQGGGNNGLIWAIHLKFEGAFEKFRDRYHDLLKSALKNRRFLIAGFVGFCAISACLVPFLGRDFFPEVDAGQIRLHVRAPAGTRIEETERRFGQVERVIQREIPRAETDKIIDNIGQTVGGVNLAIGDGSQLGTSDGEILIALKEGEHGPTADYVRHLREVLPHEFPDMTFYFQSADIVGRTLNFGLPAPIDIQISGPARNEQKNVAILHAIAARVAKVEGAADVHINQVTDAPGLSVSVDRTRASQLGLTQRDVAQSLLVSLSGSAQSAPNYWLNPQNGVNYQIAVQTPPYRLDSLDALRSTPVVTAGSSQLLSNLATTGRLTSPVNINHYNVQPVFNIDASPQDRDLGGVARDIGHIVDEYQKKLPRGSTLKLRGQIESMNASYLGLGLGLIFAVVLIYALMVVNFQSWVDPAIIICALPGALCGIVWMLFITQTTLSVPALMGAIMCMGVATANSILLVTFANDQRREGSDSTTAALEAGFTRLRPVLMTAGAMIIGMLPMALGLSEGGEQNVPLGRAVIGGLLLATPTTLLIVPVIYSIWRRKAFVDPEEVADREEREQGIAPDGSHFDPQGGSSNGASTNGNNGNGHQNGHAVNGHAGNGNGQPKREAEVSAS